MSDKGVLVTTTLEYAPCTRLSFLRRRRRQLILLGILSMLAAVAWWFRSQIVEQVKWRYAFSQLMHYEMPADGSMLQAPKVVRRMLFSASQIEPPRKAVPPPDALTTFYNVDCRSIDLTLASQIAFAGSMKRPDGQARLVIIAGDDMDARTLSHAYILVLSTPRLFESPPKQYSGRGLGWHGSWINAWLGAASRDPADPTHLTVKLIITGLAQGITETVLDAHLQNDDSIKFTYREDIPGIGRKDILLPGSPYGVQQMRVSPD